MTHTILEAEILITETGPILDMPVAVDHSGSDIALAMSAFNAFVDGLERTDIPRAGRGDDESLAGLRFRFLVEDDGAAFVGGRIA